MTVRNLEFLFCPKSVAVVAEPDEASRYAGVVLANLPGGAFAGPLMSVGAHRRSLFSIGSDVRLGEIATTPDLAILCASLDLVPCIIRQLGARGTRGVIVGPRMWHKMRRSEIAAARQGIVEAAQPSLMRLLGPGSGGRVVPGSGLNALATPVPIKPGKIAVLSQSTTIIAAGRNAGRNKPLVAIHCGRLAAVEPTDGPLRAEDVFQAALRRAGWVSVDTLGALFEAVEAMARVRPQRGDSLAILGNGHGPGRIAAETLLRAGGHLGDLSPATLRHL